MRWLAETLGVAGAAMIVGATGSALWGHGMEARHVGWIVGGVALITVAFKVEERIGPDG